METTVIHFDPKQKFETIEEIIKDNFQNYKRNKSSYINDIIRFQFDYNNETVHCWFSEDNSLYYGDDLFEYCSTLASDRVSENKVEAFRIIASQFTCKFYPNDCEESTLEIFKNGVDNSVIPIDFLYEWSDIHLDSDLTRSDCDKLIEWFQKNKNRL